MLHQSNQFLATAAPATRDDLLERMAQNGVPGGPINTLEELFSSDQVEAREMKVSVPHSAAASGRVDLIGNPVKFSKTPV